MSSVQSDRDSLQMSLNSQFKRACTGFDISVQTTITSLVSTLEALAKDLAKCQDTRTQLGSHTSLWPDLRKLWRDLARAQLTFWDGDDSEGEENHGENKKQESYRLLCASLAKFTRNLVAGVPENQTRAFENEPDIRRLLHYHTSWSAMEDDESIPVARILAQTLSNLVTDNEPLLTKIWEIYMKLPEDQDSRLLASPDDRTLLSALVFILNCIHQNRDRTKMLTRSKIGGRVCVSLLDNMVRLYDAEEGTEGAQAFDIGYDIFTRIIEENLVPDLYSRFTITDEIVTPHQTTLLKLVDSHLQAIQLNTTAPTPKTTKMQTKLSPMLAKTFFLLSEYAQQAIRRSLGPSISAADPLAPSNGHSKPSSPAESSLQPQNRLPISESSQQSPPPPAFAAELDVMLPKVCEALVLVTQCVVTITLEAEERSLQEQVPSSSATETNLKNFFNDSRSPSDHGFPESLVELLRLLDLFLPRINFGKPVVSPSASAQSTPTPTQQSTAMENAGFSYLKRDLVRLLGVLCHGTKAVQDRVRDCGGIVVVLNLCVIDERNPFLREHALFTLHNLLKDNPENQAVVGSIKPEGEFDENGVWREAAGPTGQ